MNIPAEYGKIHNSALNVIDGYTIYLCECTFPLSIFWKLSTETNRD